MERAATAKLTNRREPCVPPGRGRLCGTVSVAVLRARRAGRDAQSHSPFSRTYTADRSPKRGAEPPSQVRVHSCRLHDSLVARKLSASEFSHDLDPKRKFNGNCGLALERMHHVLGLMMDAPQEMEHIDSLFSDDWHERINLSIQYGYMNRN